MTWTPRSMGKLRTGTLGCLIRERNAVTLVFPRNVELCASVPRLKEMASPYSHCNV